MCGPPWSPRGENSVPSATPPCNGTTHIRTGAPFPLGTGCTDPPPLMWTFNASGHLCDGERVTSCRGISDTKCYEYCHYCRTTTNQSRSMSQGNYQGSGDLPFFPMGSAKEQTLMWQQNFYMNSGINSGAVAQAPSLSGKEDKKMEGNQLMFEQGFAQGFTQDQFAEIIQELSHTHDRSASALPCFVKPWWKMEEIYPPCISIPHSPSPYRD